MDQEVRDGLLSGYLRTVRFRKAIPHITGKRLLDIGCDEGYIIPYLDKEIEYIGIERDPILLKKAKNKFPDRNFYQIEITQENIKAIGIGNFDTILMTAVIEHMKEPIKIVELLSSILHRKGRIIITSPSKNSHG